MIKPNYLDIEFNNKNNFIKTKITDEEINLINNIIYSKNLNINKFKIFISQNKRDYNYPFTIKEKNNLIKNVSKYNDSEKLYLNDNKMSIVQDSVNSIVSIENVLLNLTQDYDNELHKLQNY